MNARPVDANCYSDKGPYRQRNEDVAFSDVDAGVFILTDGLGGAAAGDRAARIATDYLNTVLIDDGPLSTLPRRLLPEGVSRTVLEAMMPKHDDVDPVDKVRFAYMLAHYRVLAEGRSTGQVGMAAAVVSLWLTRGTGWLGHVGDCRGYEVSGDSIEQLTTDHSLSTALESRTSLSRSALDNPFLRSRLTQVVGGENAPVPGISEWKPRPGSRLLMCSDGVWGSVSKTELQRFVSEAESAQGASKALVEYAIAAGSRDNATALAVFF